MLGKKDKTSKHTSVPNHSSLSRIRERYSLESFQRFLEHIVELCIEVTANAKYSTALNRTNGRLLPLDRLLTPLPAGTEC